MDNHYHLKVGIQNMFKINAIALGHFVRRKDYLLSENVTVTCLKHIQVE